MKVLIFLLLIPLFVFAFLRRDKARDKVLYKITSLIMCAVSLLIMIIGLGSFNSQCIMKLPTNYDYYLGPGGNCMLTNFFFVSFILIVNLLTPVNQEGSSAGDTEPLAAAATV